MTHFTCTRHGTDRAFWNLIPEVKTRVNSPIPLPLPRLSPSPSPSPVAGAPAERLRSFSATFTVAGPESALVKTFILARISQWEKNMERR